MKRYAESYDYRDCYLGMAETHDGDWVKYSDHEAAMAELRETLDRTHAHCCALAESAVEDQIKLEKQIEGLREENERLKEDAELNAPMLARQTDLARQAENERDDALKREREMLTDLISEYSVKDGLIWSDASTEKAYYLRLAAERGIVVIESDDGQRMIAAQWADPTNKTDIN